MQKKIWSLCSWMSVSTTGLLLLSYLDTFYLTWLGDLKQVAAYNIAQPIMQIMLSLTVIPLVFLPISTELWKKKKFKELSRIFFLVNGILCCATVPLVLFIHKLGPAIITLMFGKQFTASATALTILSAGVLFYIIGQFNLNLLNSSGHQKTGTWIVVSIFLTNFFSNLLLVPRHEYCGTAAALSISYFSLFLLTFIFASLHLRIAQTTCADMENETGQTR